jgi:hypothetical protein
VTPDLVAALLTLEAPRHRSLDSLELPEAQALVRLACSCGVDFRVATGRTQAASAQGRDVSATSAGAPAATAAPTAAPTAAVPAVVTSAAVTPALIGSAELVGCAVSLNTFRRKVALSAEQAAEVLAKLCLEAGMPPLAKQAMPVMPTAAAAAAAEEEEEETAAKTDSTPAVAPERKLDLAAFLQLFR